MRRLQCALIAAVAAIGFSSIASAADMPVKAVRGPIAVPVYNWTGFYLGVHGGGTWGKTNITDIDGWNFVGDNWSGNTSGFNGGVQGGYNWQLPNSVFVLGIEGDVGYLGFKGAGTKVELPCCATHIVHVDANGGWNATIRGRLGVAWDQLLLYGTGGVIFSGIKASYTDDGNGMTTGDTGNRTGSIFGGGIEYALSRGWSVKGEYLHFNLGTSRVSLINIPTIRFDINNTGNILRLGLNYRFGGM